MHSRVHVFYNRGVLDRRQAETTAGAVAGRLARTEFTARRGPPFIDATSGVLAHLAHQRCAAWLGMVGAAQAHQAGQQIDGQAVGDMAPAT